MQLNQFSGTTFRKQLGYFNRTFLIGNYDYEGKGAIYDVVHNGLVKKFDNLQDAIKYFNKESGEEDDKSRRI